MQVGAGQNKKKLLLKVLFFFPKQGLVAFLQYFETWKKTDRLWADYTGEGAVELLDKVYLPLEFSAIWKIGEEKLQACEFEEENCSD